LHSNNFETNIEQPEIEAILSKIILKNSAENVLCHNNSKMI
jgi:hypothetical protein